MMLDQYNEYWASIGSTDGPVLYSRLLVATVLAMHPSVSSPFGVALDKWTGNQILLKDVCDY